jgi:hypothetical protein
VTNLLAFAAMVLVLVGAPLAVEYQWPALLLALVLVGTWRYLIHRDTIIHNQKEDHS